MGTPRHSTVRLHDARDAPLTSLHTAFRFEGLQTLTTAPVDPAARYRALARHLHRAAPASDASLRHRKVCVPCHDTGTLLRRAAAPFCIGTSQSRTSSVLKLLFN
ncbi:hypothetical protein NUW54_g11778 [Trametes sanguinea]|uniref:Uncharacterized protein n=1 Tax=Trametes sanguinea TaxID=158606 RepID=A0ACC1N942_9APHY|nr:hypothetical protein NUW54_g11778 [Trametes sanguinea]